MEDGLGMKNENSEFPLLLAPELPLSAFERRWSIFGLKLLYAFLKLRYFFRMGFNKFRIFGLKSRYAFLFRW
jgi:hypothetical protein